MNRDFKLRKAWARQNRALSKMAEAIPEDQLEMETQMAYDDGDLAEAQESVLAKGLLAHIIMVLEEQDLLSILPNAMAEATVTWRQSYLEEMGLYVLKDKFEEAMKE